MNSDLFRSYYKLNVVKDFCESYFIRYMKDAYACQTWCKDGLSAYVKAHGFGCCYEVVAQALAEEHEEYVVNNPFLETSFLEAYNKIVNN